MNNISEVGLELNNISALGINISLDDFGKGYSSLSRLKSLAINTLKIDRYFVADIHNEHDKVVLVDTIIKLAHELGMTAIAEGIETEEQLNYLISRYCHLGQGFFLSKPVPSEVFEKIAYLS